MVKEDNRRPLVLLDGMSLAFRAFHALPTEIATQGGIVTNALHGFASMMVGIVKDYQPRALAVAFDLPGGTFRDEMVDDYKGGRAETPPLIEHQFDLIRQFCETLRIPVLGVPRYEADDILATVASWGRDHEMPTIVVTGDRDAFQLVEDPFIKVLYPGRRGMQDAHLYDEQGIYDRCGVEPTRYPLYAAMRGDASDNLPGVPGVGEKTAAKLLQTYRDFDDLFRHLDDLTPSLRKNLAEFEERARRNVRLMTLVRDVPLDFSLDAVTLGGWSQREVHAFFEKYEMNSIRQRFDRVMRDGLLGSEGEQSDSAPLPEQFVMPNFVRTLRVADVMTGDGDIVVAFQGTRTAVLNPRTGNGTVISQEDFLAQLQGEALVGHDVKPILREWIMEGRQSPVVADDTAIMAFLVDASSGRYGLADLAERYLGVTMTSAPPTLFAEFVSDDDVWREVCVISALREVLAHEMVQWNLGEIYQTIERPLISVLARMEAYGIAVDPAMLRQIASEFTAEVAQLDQEIQAVAGHPFKVNSPQQLQVVLFDELGLTKGKKIKTGYSTDAMTLEKLVHEHPIIPLLLRFREVDKLRSTYGDTLIATVAADERIHATFHQTVARTGRLSSENPNLHNIPVRSPEGRRLRFAFVPTKGWEFAVADYNQIELRVLAHLSQDEGLLAAFAADTDLHRVIASSVFGCAVADVTHEQREQAKAVSYGLAYGMESFGLSQRLGISVGDAKEIMERYFSGFPQLRAYMDATVAEVRQMGYSRTQFGRVRPFPEMTSATGPQRQAIERQAMNAGIQGLAADIFKAALVRLDHRLHKEGLAARLVLQVHDEVIVEAPTDEKELVDTVIRSSLVDVVALRVPLEISLSWGNSWAAAKS